MDRAQVKATVVLCVAGLFFSLLITWCVWRMGKWAIRCVVIYFTGLPLLFLYKEVEERVINWRKTAKEWTAPVQSWIKWKKGRLWLRRLLGLVLVCVAMALLGVYAALAALGAVLLFLKYVT
ncbi:unnamed protein product [Prorocentrum cordatum]|uniref:Transmembrane protein n=1 Tax=Prorocentrum cordatum TaxID=2364126 RepID=A0ABN9R6A2_9DINO|nr:unnamed protein product [Polarella glacialis]